MAWFKGALYLARHDVLYRLEDETMQPVDVGQTDIPFSFARFIVSHRQLITVGPKDVMRFDGATWSRID